MSRMTPIGGAPDPRGIDRNDKKAMSDYRQRKADFDKRLKEYNSASPERQRELKQQYRDERAQRRAENPRPPRKEKPGTTGERPDRTTPRPRRPIRDRMTPGGRRSCPDPNMFILMADGSHKKAGELVVGDLVKTYHEKDLENEVKLARNKSLVLSSAGVEKNSHVREQLENSYAKAALGEYKVEFVDIVKNVEKIKLSFEGSEIVCSLTHKFYVNNSWKEAKDMTVGDKVSGKKLLSVEDFEDGDVVHITIENAHTYICEGLLSHNKRYASPRPDPESEKEPKRDPRRPGGRRTSAERRRRMQARRRRMKRRRAMRLARRRRRMSRRGGRGGRAGLYAESKSARREMMMRRRRRRRRRMRRR